MATRPALLRLSPLFSHAGWYVLIGAVCTGLQALLFAALQSRMDSHLANLLAIIATTLINTEFHRRVTFSSSPDRPLRRYLQAAFSVCFYATAGSLMLFALHATTADPSAALQTVVVTVTSAAGGVARFVLLRYWVFARAKSAHGRTYLRPLVRAGTRNRL